VRTSLAWLMVSARMCVPKFPFSHSFFGQILFDHFSVSGTMHVRAIIMIWSAVRRQVFRQFLRNRDRSSSTAFLGILDYYFQTHYLPLFPSRTGCHWFEASANSSILTPFSATEQEYIVALNTITTWVHGYRNNDCFEPDRMRTRGLASQKPRPR